MVVAFDFGGTSIKLGLVHGEDVLVQTTIEGINTSLIAPLLPQLKSSVSDLCQKAQLDENSIECVGMALPSIVDSKKGVVLSEYIKYQDFNQANLHHWVRKQWQCDLRMENDARAALVGEWQYGAGKGLDNFIMVTLGTGMGTAAVVNGTLLRGKHYVAGNLGGHMSLNFQGRKCNCGSIGCVETEASTWALPQLVRNHKGYSKSTLANKELDFKLLFTEAEHDEVANDILNHCLDAWAFGIFNLVHSFDPEKVALSGGVMASGDKIIDRIKQVLNDYSWLPKDATKIEKARRPNDAALLGLGYLCTNNI